MVFSNFSNLSEAYSPRKIVRPVENTEGPFESIKLTQFEKRKLSVGLSLKIFNSTLQRGQNKTFTVDKIAIANSPGEI